MNNSLLSPLHWLKHRSDLAASVSLRYSGAVLQQGWFRSVRERAPVDADGNPIPWISYPALRFLEKRVRPGWNVFEFGAGNSTLWWAPRVKQVVSCEADGDWHARVSKLAPGNAKIIRVDETGYPGVLEGQSLPPDVIVIDGGDRCHCAAVAADAVSEEGVILWDDSERPEYAKGIGVLREAGFREIEFSGLAPIVNILKSTSVFYRPGNVLEI